MWLRGKREENILKGYKCGKALRYAFAFDSKSIGFRNTSAIQLQAMYRYNAACSGSISRLWLHYKQFEGLYKYLVASVQAPL